MVEEGASIVGFHAPCEFTVLTFDDGPDPQATVEILEALGEAGATATFFVLLTRARRYPGMLQMISDAGHEIALHGRDHVRLTDLTPSDLPKLLQDSRDELEQLCGVGVRWYRPTYGAQNRALWHAAQAARLECVFWEVECRDWLTLQLDDYLAPVRTATLPGSVILLHDGFADVNDGVDDGPPPTLDRAQLVRAVTREAAQQQLKVLSLAHAVRQAAPRRRVWLDKHPNSTSPDQRQRVDR